MNNNKNIDKQLECGSTFGSWTVKGYSHKNAQGNWYYDCICACGKEQAVKASNLRAGKSTACRSCRGKQNGRKGLNAQVKKHLYVIECEGYTKIGSTDNIYRRIKNIENANPLPIILSYYGEYEGYMEPIFHEALKEYHYKGEWFKL